MGLFKRKDACAAWLDKLDTVYTDALRTKNTRLLEPYFTRKCLSKVVEIVASGNSAMCGLERYREVTFTLSDRTSDYVVYRKDVRYKNVNMGYGVIVPVGDAYSELWMVVPRDGKYIVSDIKECSVL